MRLFYRLLHLFFLGRAVGRDLVPNSRELVCAGVVSFLAPIAWLLVPQTRDHIMTFGVSVTVSWYAGWEVANWLYNLFKASNKTRSNTRYAGNP